MTTHIESARHHRWEELSVDRPMEKISRRRIIGRKLMVSEVRVEKGCIVPMHAHDNEQLAYVVSGRLRFGIGRQGGDSPGDFHVQRQSHDPFKIEIQA